jgi:outer membrane protein insertion porin family
VAFLDAGALYEEVGKWTGTRRDNARNFDSDIQRIKSQLTPLEVYIRERYNPFSLRPIASDQNPFDKDDPDKLVLRQSNIALNNMKYSWGVGLRVQIPVLPLRLYFAQRLRYEEGAFLPYEEAKNFQFVFGIGDFRF